MNNREAAKFADRIKRQAWHQVRVKRGKTNGAHTFHIVDLEAKDKRRASTTIYTVADWLVHPLNKLNKPQEKRDQTLDEYVKTFTQETARMQALMGRLSEDAIGVAAAMANLNTALADE